MTRTLFGNLTLALLGILGLMAVANTAVTLFITRNYILEVSQKLNLELAQHIAAETDLLENGQVNQDSLKEIFHMMMVIHPAIELYLIDPQGQILAFSAPEGKVKREHVAIEPIEAFLKQSAPLPILGDDPRGTGRRKAFSAAPIRSDEGFEGYLYVVLGGEQYDSAVEMVQGSYIMRLGTGALFGSLIFSLAAGLLLFNWITRRLRRLSVAMEAFQHGGFKEPVAPLGFREDSADEIGRLGSTFEQMSGRMIDQLRRLEREDISRRELVANISHDLRTPLASVQGYLETLQLKADTLTAEERDRYLSAASRQSENLGQLIGQLFELATLDSAEAKAQLEPVALGDLVQDVVQKFQLDAARNQVDLEALNVEGLPLVEADTGLIDRVLQNLIDNALHHTPEGGRVAIALNRLQDAVAVRVTDTGCGIPADEIPRVFERFYRKSNGACRKSEGAGLGLAITKRILELHGSDIAVDSKPGEGTTFEFLLPIHRT